jgi:phenylpyruvate tautomerase PptA (4-oxalocrotonate tautomerase family)
VPKEAVWVVFDEVAAKDWYVGSTSVAQMRAGQS